MTTPSLRPGAIRASDQDRHDAISRLSEHYAQGRLDLEEFSVRMESAQRATYLEDLVPLFADLPEQRPVALPYGAGRHRRWLPFAVLAVVLLAVLAMTHGHFPWLLVPFVWFVAARHPAWGGRWQRAHAAAHTGARTAVAGRGQTTP